MQNKDSSNERLASWMKSMRLIDRDVAAATGVDTAHVWRIRKGKCAVPDSFAWKFAAAYGYETARRLFDAEKVMA